MPVLVGLLAVLTLSAALLVRPSAARADNAPIPADAAAPGTDPNHGTPLEVLASLIASTIAGRPVSVRCENESDWNTLAAQRSFDPSAVLGLVASPSYYVATNRFAWSATTAELSPTACSSLQQFAVATTKPTKCATTTQQAVTVYKTVRYSVRTWVKVRKRLRLRVVWRTKQVPTTTFLDVPGPPAPCYVNGALAPAASSAYEAYAQTIHTLAHEPIHLWQAQAGARVPPDALVESQAVCSGMQWMPYVAEQLGDTPDDAQAIATYFWNIDYPRLSSLSDPYSQSHPYSSADCTPGGALDIRPAGSTAWP